MVIDVHGSEMARETCNTLNPDSILYICVPGRHTPETSDYARPTTLTYFQAQRQMANRRCNKDDSTMLSMTEF